MLTKVENVLGDGIGSIELVGFTVLTEGYHDKFIVDQMPLLAARVSTNRDDKTGLDPKADKKLLRFLAKNKHLSPFEHVSFTFNIVAPIMVFREWHRHRTQSYNEFSMRYSGDMVGQVYIPPKWRVQSKTNKQGSVTANFSEQEESALKAILTESYHFSQNAYETMMNLGAAKELARLCVPVGNYSKMYATANVRNWWQFWQLRADEAAQWEIRQYAFAVGKIIESIIPSTWHSLTEFKSVDLTQEQIKRLLTYIQFSNSAAKSAFGLDNPTDEMDKEIIAALEKAQRHGTVQI